jgi:uncharacterized protein (DUF2164 family)
MATVEQVGEKKTAEPPIGRPCIEDDPTVIGPLVYTQAAIDKKTAAVTKRLDGLEKNILITLEKLPADDKVRAALGDVEQRLTSLEKRVAELASLEARIKDVELRLQLIKQPTSGRQ